MARPIIDAAQDQKLDELSVSDVSELPGKGLSGIVGERRVSIVGRKHFPKEDLALLPAVAPGLECIVLLDGRYAGLIRMRDEPREEGAVFVKHLGPRHGVNEVILLSGDRENEVEYLANKVGIKKIYFGKSPDEKVSIVKEETKKHRTLFLGDGINDAPALLAATVGIAFGPRSEITSEAAGAVILDPSLRKVDELMHISRRMRSVAVQSAVGGMALSIFGMGFAAYGLLTPVAGAILQEAIDVLAVFNALRAALPPKLPSHF